MGIAWIPQASHEHAEDVMDFEVHLDELDEQPSEWGFEWDGQVLFFFAWFHREAYA